MTEHTGLGLAALILGILSVLSAVTVILWRLAFILGPIALILGLVSRFGKAKDSYGTVAIILSIISIFISGCLEAAYSEVEKTPSEGRGAEGPSLWTPGSPAKIILENYSPSFVELWSIDKANLGSLEVSLRNDGDEPAEIYKLALSISGQNYEQLVWENLNPKERKTFTIYGLWGAIGREIGNYTIKCKLEVQDKNSRILLTENLTFAVSTIGIGDTIAEIEGTDNMSLTLLRWVESDIAVEGPYADGNYYTFTAKPNMKFVIVIYMFQNNGRRPQETPYIDSGEIATDKGFIYPSWHSPLGIWSEEYLPRKATDNEVRILIGSSGGYVKLQPGTPGESVVGRIVFEIPRDARPIEAKIDYIPYLVKF
jgi:hypothetical protein